MADLNMVSQPRRFTLANRVAITVLALLCIPVAAASLRYLAPGLPGVPSLIEANAHFLPFLPIHAGFGAIALLVGPWQFLPGLRRKRVRLHRLIGATYVIACLSSGAVGLLLATGSAAGPIASAGFGLMAISWVVTTALGLIAALRGRFASHRRWMVRSFAVTFAAVTQRLLLPMDALVGLDFQTWYLAVSFLCWAPNLVVAEVYLLITGRGAQNHPASRSAE